MENKTEISEETAAKLSEQMEKMRVSLFNSFLKFDELIIAQEKLIIRIVEKNYLELLTELAFFEFKIKKAFFFNRWYYKIKLKKVHQRKIKFEKSFERYKINLYAIHNDFLK